MTILQPICNMGKYRQFYFFEFEFQVLNDSVQSFMIHASKQKNKFSDNGFHKKKISNYAFIFFSVLIIPSFVSRQNIEMGELSLFSLRSSVSFFLFIVTVSNNFQKELWITSVWIS